MKQRHRIFIAINLPQDIKKKLADYEKKWSELPAKWVSRDNLHITLIFLGDLTDIELGEVCVTTKEIVKNYNSFNINLNKVGYGPDNKIPPKMIWASGDPLPHKASEGQRKISELSLLKKDLEEALLQKVNFIPENRGFTPHITMARISTFKWRAIEPEERPEVNENIDLEFTVESIDVMESVLKKSGPEYIIIESNVLT